MEDKSKLPNDGEKVRRFAARLCLLTVLAAAAAFSYVRIWNPDFWFHLKVGEIIYSNAADSSISSKLPTQSLFYTPGSSNAPIYDQWLGDLYLYAAYEKSGIHGVQKLSVAISLFICFALFFAARNGGADPILATPLIAASLLISRYKLAGHTPDMFFYLFLVLLFYLLNQMLKSDDNGDANAKSLKRALQAAFIIPVAQVIWVNFHHTAAISIFLISAALFGSIFAFVLNVKCSFSLQPSISSLTLKILGVTLLITIVATVLNPNWFHAYSIPLISRIEYMPLSSPLGIAYFSFVVLGLFGFIISGKSINLFHLIVFFVSGIFAFIARESAPVFFLLSAPIISITLSAPFKMFFKTGALYFASAVVSICVIALSIFCAVTRSDSFVWGNSNNDVFYPESVVEFLNANDFAGNMYNSSAFSGPLAWGIYPKQTPFLCNNSSNVCKDFVSFEVNPSPSQWLILSNDNKIDFAVLNIENADFALKLTESTNDWKIVFWDSSAIIIVRNIPAHNKLLSAYSFKIALTPSAAIEVSSNWENLSPETRLLLLVELERAFNASNRNSPAASALAMIMKYDKNWNRVLAFCNVALSQDNKDAAMHALMGEALLAKGDMDGASKSFNIAADIDPSYKNLLNSIIMRNTSSE
jgi:hypothetical protein